MSSVIVFLFSNFFSVCFFRPSSFFLWWVPLLLPRCCSRSGIVGVVGLASFFFESMPCFVKECVVYV